MDISFTNVLEGARQYFQGLPAASSSSGSPATQIGQRENDGSVHSEQHSAVPYWDHQNEGQGTNLPNRDVMNPPQGNRTVQTHQNPTASYHYEKGQTYSNYPATSQISHVYQSHIPPSSAYYEVPPQQSKASYVSTSQAQPVVQHATPTVNTSSNYIYHSQNTPIHNTHSYQNYSTQNSTSSSSQSQDIHYNYKMYNQQASRSQSSYPSNYYQNPPSIHHHQQQQQQQQPQQHQQQQSQQQQQQPQPQQQQPQQRVTHQLPAVPADIYHSRSVAKPVQHQMATINPTNYPNRTMHNAAASTNPNESRISLQNGTSYSDQYKYYQNTPAKYTASSYSVPTTTTTYSNQYGNTNQFVDTRVREVQRQLPQVQQSKYVAQMDAKLMVASNPQKLANISKQKRESPLDLSVKTVKTSADSTLTDYDDRTNRAIQNLVMQKYQTARAPKVDFLPNFNMPPSSVKEDVRTTSKTYYNYPMATSGAVPPRETLPRIDFPSLNKNANMGNIPRKRPIDHAPSTIPEKMPKVDTWRQTIDKQIEQRLSSYTKSRLEQDQQKMLNNKNINGNMHAQIPQNKPTSYAEMQQRYGNTTDINNYKIHSSVSGVYQYPQISNAYPHMQPYQNQVKPKSSQPAPNKQTTANKKVLSLLRNSLQIKGAKEAQKKMEQEQLIRQSYREIQQPSTDVMAPLQPKPGIIGRRNVSPFTAASLDRNSSTPPAYKFHLPKAIDSVIFSDSEKEQQEQQAYIMNRSTPTTDLDGLAAFLAARIRTKAELKQVGPAEQIINNNMLNVMASSLSLAPKLKEPSATSTPKKLFCRTENGDQINHKLNKRSEVGGIRSSSETSVFDFPDSDNETEAPVLDRQSLVEMRKDRKTVPTQFTGKIEELDVTRPVSPFDMLFSQTCDTFMEQLRAGNGKKRGRRKKSKGQEDDVNDVPIPVSDIKREPGEIKTEPSEIKKEPDIVDEVRSERVLEGNVVVKIEVEEIAVSKTPEAAPVTEVVKEVKLEVKTPEVIKLKDKSDSDSDTPLIVCKNKIQKKVIKEEIHFIKPLPDISNEISSDSELECASKNVRVRKKKDLKSILLDLKDVGTIHISKPGKKPTFGDGSDFHPGWEEELYRYKKSLRMPRMLIQVTRPPNCQRLSTSLPDLDPCPVSPAQSSVADLDEKRKTTFKLEGLDSDVDSNCSFNFMMSKINYDSEEGSSSVKSLSLRNNSILDKLLERYGGRKRKRQKKMIDDGPKTIPKSEKEVELLRTPSLEVQKRTSVVKTDSVVLGFRKKTMHSFRDAFINNRNTIVGVNEFTTVVMKSRTRKETRVLKEKATIREVFGEDRPASAPPVTCLDEIKRDDDDEDKGKKKEKPNGKSGDKLTNLFNRNLNDAFFKALTNKKIKCEENADAKKDDDTKTDISSNDGETTKKRIKLRNIRRKFSSGFDYIRKKKKQIKKEDVEGDLKPKSKKRLIVAKARPESVQDIKKEIKMWVLNKGVGETHLHRAARSGFTDITAYCLEHMSCTPSPKDNAGYTPLHEACSKGHLDIARLLLQYGAHVSESAQGGIRPLHEAAENGFVEIVRLLLSYGADPTLATYSGITPLQLAVDDTTVALLQQHLAELQGKCTIPWCFTGPTRSFDPPDLGYNALAEVPEADPLPEEDDVELEVSEQLLPNLYTLPDSSTDRWVLLQDLSTILKIKSKDTLLRQLNVVTSNTNKSDIVRELKTVDFLEQARCCQFLNANEKLNTRSSKIFLVKYTEKVKRLLNIEKVIINVR